MYMCCVYKIWGFWSFWAVKGVGFWNSSAKQVLKARSFFARAFWGSGWSEIMNYGTGQLPPNRVDPEQPSSCFLQKFKLYETRSNFYLIGRDKCRTFWRVLKIDRLDPSELNILEDPATYSDNECYDLLKRIDEGNKSMGGLKLITICYGIVGFVKFLGPYYMIIITKRRKIGTICGHTIYAISKSEMIPVPNPTVRSKLANSKNDENRSFVHFACKCNMYLVLGTSKAI